jgi:hypothetical protein
MSNPALGDISRESINMMKGVLNSPLDGDLLRGSFQKGVSISTGLTWYDLEAPAKNIYPTITPLRNSIPRVGPRGAGMHPGDAAHWKVIRSLTGSGYDSMGWVPEGQRSGAMSYSSTPVAKTYVTLGEEDFLTFEAEAAAQGFEDENAMVTFRLLQKMMRKEEIGIIGGNSTLALGTPGTPSVAATANTASTLASATYYVQVVALTLEGYKNSSLANGVATSRTITGSDGKVYTLSGGSSALSLISSGQATTVSTTMLDTWVVPVAGAVAYAWYVGTVNATGTGTLQAITTVANLRLSVPIVAGRQSASAIMADNSTNSALAFDGLLSYGFNPANGATVTTMAQSTVTGVSAGLTTSNRGSIVEIDTMLEAMWDNFNLGPTVMYVNSQEQRNISNKVLATSSAAPLLRYDSGSTPGGPYAITAGGVIDYYYNPFSHEAGYKLPVKIHPDVPAGTILMWCERLPPWYQSNEVPNVAEMKIRRDYYRVDWPLHTRQREYGVYAEEVLAVYAPFSIGILTNIANA